ncbi:MAG: hypothetical protein ACKO9H_09225 [Planctomycetota bacterium]
MVRSLSSVFAFVALVALTATTFAQCCDTATSCDNGSRVGGRVFNGRVATWRSNRTAARCATPVNNCGTVSNCGTGNCGTTVVAAAPCNTGCATACNTGCNRGCGTMVASAPCASNMTYTNYVPASSDCGCGTVATSSCNSCGTACGTNDCCNNGRTRSFRVFNRRSNNCCNNSCSTGCSSCGTVASTGCTGSATPTAAVAAPAAESTPPAPAEDK